LDEKNYKDFASLILGIDIYSFPKKVHVYIFFGTNRMLGKAMNISSLFLYLLWQKQDHIWKSWDKKYNANTHKWANVDEDWMENQKIKLRSHDLIFKYNVWRSILGVGEIFDTQFWMWLLELKAKVANLKYSIKT
jgi:hypothetical protein